MFECSVDFTVFSDSDESKTEENQGSSQAAERIRVDFFARRHVLTFFATKKLSGGSGLI